MQREIIIYLINIRKQIYIHECLWILSWKYLLANITSEACREACHNIPIRWILAVYMYVHICISISQVEGEENKRYNRRMLYWKRRMRAGSRLNFKKCNRISNFYHKCTNVTSNCKLNCEIRNKKFIKNLISFPTIKIFHVFVIRSSITAFAISQIWFSRLQIFDTFIFLNICSLSTHKFLLLFKK